jgi:hypothetical protein
MTTNLTTRTALLNAEQQTCSIDGFPEYPPVYHDFVTDTEATAKSNRINIKCYNNINCYNKFLRDVGKDDKTGSGAYFSSWRRELAISTYDTNITRLMMLFIHESCHMDQWFEHKRVWGNNAKGIFNFFPRS